MIGNLATAASDSFANANERSASACDADLLLQLQAGEPGAYESLVRQHGGRMLATARRFFRCQQDAADAVQDAFLGAFKAIKSFQGNSQLGTWLHRIVVNACLMRRRSQERHPAVSIDGLLPSFDSSGHHLNSIKPMTIHPFDTVAVDEVRRQIRDCIDRLPAPYREILILRDIEELDTQAAAEMLGITIGVAKTRLHRARLALRTLLEPILQA